MTDLGLFSSPGAEYTPGIRFKTAAAILAVGQRLLSYIACRGFMILQWDNSSRLLHLQGLIVLADSKSRGMLLLTGESHFLRCYKLSLSFDIFCGIFESFTILLTRALFKQDVNLTFSYEKMTNHYFFVLKSDKSLLFRNKK